MSDMEHCNTVLCERVEKLERLHDAMRAELDALHKDLDGLKNADKVHEDKLGTMAADIGILKGTANAVLARLGEIEDAIGRVPHKALVGAGVPGVAVVIIEVVKYFTGHH